MATNKEFVDYLSAKLKHIPDIKIKAMFGEYALYCKNVVVGLICDNTFFVKINAATNVYFGALAEKGFPYKGAKEAYIIDESLLNDKQTVRDIIVSCADLLIKQKTR